jgi:hypothetical protein
VGGGGAEGDEGGVVRAVTGRKRRISEQDSLRRKVTRGMDRLAANAGTLVQNSALLQLDLEQKVAARFDPHHRQEIIAEHLPFIKPIISQADKEIAASERDKLEARMVQTAALLAELLQQYQVCARSADDQLYDNSVFLGCLYDGSKDEAHHVVSPPCAVNTVIPCLFASLAQAVLVKFPNRQPRETNKSYRNAARDREAEGEVDVDLSPALSEATVPALE